METITRRNRDGVPFVLAGAVVALLLASCSPPADSNTQPAADTATAPDVTDAQEADVAMDADAAIPDGGDSDGGSGGPTRLEESEPNNGASDTEFNTIPTETPAVIAGTITAGDADIFKIEPAPTNLFVVELTTPSGSDLQGHLTVFDDGRDGDRAGADYRKIATGNGPSHRVVFMTMGDGGYFLAVRDERNVGTDKNAGGDAFDYELSVESVPLSDSEYERTELSTQSWPSQPISGTLDFAGDLAIFPFEAREGDDIVASLSTSGDFDGRLLVVAEETGSWIARQDDRSRTNSDPLIDAPMSAGGQLYLLVENIEPGVSSLDWELSVERP